MEHLAPELPQREAITGRYGSPYLITLFSNWLAPEGHVAGSLRRHGEAVASDRAIAAAESSARNKPRGLAVKLSAPLLLGMSENGLPADTRYVMRPS